MSDGRAERRTTSEDDAEGGAATGETEEGYTRVSPCIILRSLEKAKATAGCVTFRCFAYGRLKTLRDRIPTGAQYLEKRTYASPANLYVRYYVEILRKDSRFKFSFSRTNSSHLFSFLQRRSSILQMETVSTPLLRRINWSKNILFYIVAT